MLIFARIVKGAGLAVVVAAALPAVLVIGLLLAAVGLVAIWFLVLPAAVLPGPADQPGPSGKLLAALQGQVTALRQEVDSLRRRS